MNQPNEAVIQAAASRPHRPEPPSLDELRSLASRARSLEQEKADLEERLKATNKELNELYFRTLPDVMDEAGVGSIALPVDGNNPPVELKAQPYYAANIAAGWPPERRQAGFDWLDQHGHGDLIKTEVTVRFPRGQMVQAWELVETLKERELAAEIKQAVSHQTLTAWLREQVEEHQKLPPLDTIGATVGRVVKLKTKEA